MNTYTLDPGSTTASEPTSVPVSAPMYVPPYYPYPLTCSVQPDRYKIHDWLPWSIINLFIGGIVLGFLPLMFTLICRNNKKYNEIHSARTMSILALVFNIIITMMGIAVLIGFFIYLFVFTQAIRDYN